MLGWKDFKAETERIFGLSFEQKQEQFFALTKSEGEGDAAFVLRVE